MRFTGVEVSGNVATAYTRAWAFGLLIKGKYALPVVLHADHDPRIFRCFGKERLGECADTGVRKISGRAIGVFALRVVVEDEHHQARSITCLRPFQHLSVA